MGYAPEPDEPIVERPEDRCPHSMSTRSAPSSPPSPASSDGKPVAYLDGPGGTQVPQRVIDAVVGYYTTMNANHEGAFATSAESDAMVEEAHAAVADFLGAGSPDEIKFGQNMSTLTLQIGRSIGATLGPRDEVVVTTLDHEANVSTWKAMAADRGVTVHQVDIRQDDVTLDLEDLESKLGPRTRLVAIGYASNAVGSINPVKAIIERAHEVGAMTYVDAVAYAPHGPIDVRALDTDFLVTSVYKWFGPHLGALYGKAHVLDDLPAFKVRPAADRFETGTLVVRIDRGDPGGHGLPARRRPVVRRRVGRAGSRATPASDAASSSPGWSRSPTTNASSSRG